MMLSEPRGVVSRVTGSCLSARNHIQGTRRTRKTYFSHPSTAATPTKAALSSGLISFPFPGAVNVLRVESIRDAIGIAGCVADGNRGMSSELDMVIVI